MLNDLLRLQMDMLGARGELAAGLAWNWLLNKVAPQGNGGAVVTFPGFLASENSLLRLNRFLNSHGFEARSWGLGRNLGPRDMTWEQLLDRMVSEVGKTVRELADVHGAPVALVGQSLGGVYARELALQMPEEIDRVIMLGSPTFHPYMTASVNRVISLFGYWMSRQSQAELAGRTGLLHWDPDQPPLPCVSVHSPADGVVDETCSVIPQYIIEQSDASAPRENLRVMSTHIGMTINPCVLLAIADRLAQDRNSWEPFDPYRYFPGNLHWLVNSLYPAPGDYQSVPDITALAGTG